MIDRQAQNIDNNDLKMARGRFGSHLYIVCNVGKLKISYKIIFIFLKKKINTTQIL